MNPQQIPQVTLPNQVFRTINGRQIYWQGGSGKIHICEGSDVHRDVRLLWTLCERDVPADAAFISPNQVEATCPKCVAISRGHVWCSRCEQEMETREAAGGCEDHHCPMVIEP